MGNRLNFNHIPLDDSFRDPAPLYRGAPFWSWNGDIEADEARRQIEVFKAMGIGGFHIHSRTGLATEYLGDEFMDLVKACRDHGRKHNMLTWLYDEDRCPSGFAGGIVTREERYRRRYLLFTSTPDAEHVVRGGTGPASGRGRDQLGTLLATYAISLDNGFLVGHRQVRDAREIGQGETYWYAYLNVAEDMPNCNGQTFVDSLNPEAIQRFIAVTYERYKEAVGDSFGTDIPAIFTDEPQHIRKRELALAAGCDEAVLPWTADLDEAFTHEFSESILDHLPEIIWDLPDHAPSLWRYRYHRWVAERFAASFTDQIGAWCAVNGIALSGHLMEEPTLQSQNMSLSDAMRSYRCMQIPGIDILCDRFEPNTAKQAQSVARQFGRPGLITELYGVTGWDYDFKGHKAQGDWQAALGCLFRVHHLSWYCMRGEAKRDYPASISFQSPWYKEYPIIEDHFARLGAVLSRGKAVCRIGVIHPIESYWLCAGPSDTSVLLQEALEAQFSNQTRWLLQALLDFDFISESLLPHQEVRVTEAALGVGDMNYEIVVVPGLQTLRSTTVDRLEAFAQTGGKILFAGEIPSLVDGQSSNRARVLATRCDRVPFERVALLQALQPFSDVEFLDTTGHRPRTLIHQLREEGDERYLFLCNTEREGLNAAVTGTVSIRGQFAVTAMNTEDGTQCPVASTHRSGRTCVEVHIPAVGHLLLRLKPGAAEAGRSLLPAATVETGRVSSPVPVNLDEPNVLLFDKASFSINGGEWQAEMPLLHVENALRAELGMVRKSGMCVQPWVDQKPVTELATIRLRVVFESRVPVFGTQLGLENLKESSVTFDGSPVPMVSTGYFADKAISTIALPDFDRGSHVVEIQLSYTRETSVEWFYLLGDFGVVLEGTRAVVIEPVRKLGFGDWTHQGLPFYGGNVTYHCTSPSDGNVIQIPQYKATTIRVGSEGKNGSIYRQPHMADLPLKQGANLDITLFGHRANCFGPVHLAEPMEWLGPNAWRVDGSRFSPEYQLKPLGLMSAPIVLRR